MIKERIITKINDFPGYLKSWATTFTGGLTIVCLLLLIAMPFFSSDPSYIYVFLPQFSLAMIFAIFAASWDLLTGISGQISFGHAIFFGIAGYFCAYFLKYWGAPIWLAIFIGCIMSVVFNIK